jgi:RNA polymerase sigma-70 factor, ECF subfamily
MIAEDKPKRAKAERPAAGTSGSPPGAGDHERFEALALPHLESLYRTGLRMTRKREEAEDLVQETFMKAFRSFRTFKPDTNIRAWLFKILTNSYINRYRKQQNQPSRTRFEDVAAFLASAEAEQTTHSVHEMEDFALDERLDSEVKTALDELPEEFRLVVIMAMVEEMSYKDIATALDIPIGTVMSRLYRGRQALKQRLADYARAHGYGGN